MTMPVERTASVIAARRFLYDLLSNEHTSAEVKRQVQSLLRHYPSANEVMQMAKKEEHLQTLMKVTVTNTLLATAEADDSGQLALLIQRDGEIRT